MVARIPLAEQDKIVKEYPIKGAATLAKEMGRTTQSLKSLVMRLRRRGVNIRRPSPGGRHDLRKKKIKRIKRNEKAKR